MKAKELMQLLEGFAPAQYACSWDNVGLLVGSDDKEVNKVVVALDATNEVVEAAVNEGADMIITHHPILFSAVKRINNQDFMGRKLLKLMEHQIACFAMHTNFDVIGMADLAGKYMGFPADAEPLEVTAEQDGKLEGIGKIAKLSAPVTLGEYAQLAKKALKLENVLLFGDENKEIQVAAISPGSGRSMIKEAVAKGADVLITGDIGHHEGLDAMDMGLSIIEAGHYGTEYIFIDYVTQFLKENTDLMIVPVESGSPYKVV